MISDFGLSTRDTRTNTLQPMFYLVLTLGSLYLLILGFRVGGTSWESLRSDLFNLPVAITATGFLGWAMRLQTPTMQRLMQPFFWGVVCHVLADILQAMLEFGFKIQLNSNPIDLIYVLSSLLYFVGLLRIPLRKISRVELLRLSLDVVLLILTVGILFWTSFLDKILEAGGQLQIPGTVGFFSASPDLHRIPFNGTPLDDRSLRCHYCHDAKQKRTTTTGHSGNPGYFVAGFD